MISIIIPGVNDSELMKTTLADLREQSGEFEVIVVNGEIGELPGVGESRARVISAPGASRGERLNQGAAAASGQVLLFLWPGSRLSPGALTAIEQNLQLLPQTVGGNFHLKFSRQNFVTGLLARLVKRWRYQGRYDGHSGIFIRKKAFLALDGFRAYEVLEDYDLVRRLETYGPTVYLPQTIVVPLSAGDSLKMLFLYSLAVLGIDPLRFARLR